VYLLASEQYIDSIMHGATVKKTAWSVGLKRICCILLFFTRRRK